MSSTAPANTTKPSSEPTRLTCQRPVPALTPCSSGLWLSTASRTAGHERLDAAVAQTHGSGCRESGWPLRQTTRRFGKRRERQRHTSCAAWSSARDTRSKRLSDTVPICHAQLRGPHALRLCRPTVSPRHCWRRASRVPWPVSRQWVGRCSWRRHCVVLRAGTRSCDCTHTTPHPPPSHNLSQPSMPPPRRTPQRASADRCMTRFATPADNSTVPRPPPRLTHQPPLECIHYRSAHQLLTVYPAQCASIPCTPPPALARCNQRLADAVR